MSPVAWKSTVRSSGKLSDVTVMISAPTDEQYESFEVYVVKSYPR